MRVGVAMVEYWRMFHGNPITGIIDWVLMNLFTLNMIPIGILFLLVQFLPNGRKIGLITGAVWLALTVTGWGIQGEKLIGLYPKNPMERMKEDALNRAKDNSLGQKAFSAMNDTPKEDPEPEPEAEEEEAPQPAADDSEAEDAGDTAASETMDGEEGDNRDDEGIGS